MSTSQPAPDWLYLPLPANADHNPGLLQEIEQHCSKLPQTFAQLQKTLDGVRTASSYEPAANQANELIWAQINALLVAHSTQRIALVRYGVEHMPERMLARVLRRLAKDPDIEVRTAVRKALKKVRIREVALPQKEG